MATVTIDHKLQQCLSGGVQAFSMAHRPSFTPALMRDVIMQVGHFPCHPQGGKLSQLNPTCCIGKTILGGIHAS